MSRYKEPAHIEYPQYTIVHEAITVRDVLILKGILNVEDNESLKR